MLLFWEYSNLSTCMNLPASRLSLAALNQIQTCQNAWTKTSWTKLFEQKLWEQTNFKKKLFDQKYLKKMLEQKRRHPASQNYAFAPVPHLSEGSPDVPDWLLQNHKLIVVLRPHWLWNIDEKGLHHNISIFINFQRIATSMTQVIMNSRQRQFPRQRRRDRAS